MLAGETDYGPKQPIGDPIPITTDTEVLDNMIDSLGQGIAQNIVERIKRGGVRRIFPMGPPGIGKTTFSLQLAREIARSAPEFGVITLEFDDILALTERELGPASTWTTNEWDRFSKNHVRTIDELDSRLGPNSIKIIDLVGVGVTNRDVAAFEELALREDPANLFLPIIADPRIQQKAYEIRRAVRGRNSEGEYDIPDAEIIRFLASNNLLVSGSDGLSPEDAGRRIRKLIEKMDRLLIPLTVETEAEEDEILKRKAASIEDLPTGTERLPELSELFLEQSRLSISGGEINPAMPAQVYDSGLSSIEILSLESIAEYYERRKRDLRLPRANFMPIYNLLIQGKPIHYLDLKGTR